MSVVSERTSIIAGYSGPGSLVPGTRSDAPGWGEGGPTSKGIVASFGFWVFLLSDIVMFSAFFAAFQVAAGTAHEPLPHLNMSSLAIETICLLFSSFLCGIASLGAAERNYFLTQAGLLFAGVLGAVFLGIEIHEFANLAAQHEGPRDGAAYSAFFALVGCHGLHVSVGLLWLGTMMAQIFAKGFRQDVVRRLSCFSLFWHALDIVWVAIFSLVYLLRFSP